MIMVDTSVWIDHLHHTCEDLKELLYSGQAAVHPYIMGELACGNISNRKEVLSLLGALPRIETVLDEEVLKLIGEYKLFDKGLGYIDVHLLASALIHHVPIWTRDKSLNSVVREFGINC